MLLPMIYRFGDFELDIARAELRAAGELRPLEPQVFSLLALLVENRERLLSRDEIIEKVWDGRIVSDAAVASRIKSARQALGDDGQAQRFIRTVQKKGFRFVAEASVVRSSATLATGPANAGDLPATESTRPSIAVLPFRLAGSPDAHAAIGDALADELIIDLARLRWLFVTARGSTFRLREPDADIGAIGRLLGVRYCLQGSVEVTGARLGVSASLVDTRNDGIIWAERFSRAIDDVNQLLADVGAQILAALEVQIPLHEAALARTAAIENLDAWSAYHLGLQHMYRFNREDNAAASALFRQAVTLDPRFARAHAGLSFVHFQTAFMRHTNDVAGEIRLARRSGSMATSRAHSSGSSARRRSAPTMPRASMPAPGPKRWPDRASRVAATWIWRCASARSIRSTTQCSEPAPSPTCCWARMPRPPPGPSVPRDHQVRMC